MHIAIDARIINSTTGRYIERLLYYLQSVDHKNEYSVLLLAKDTEYWKPSQPNFKVVVANFNQYSFAEQFGLKKLLQRLKPDLVHFCMPQQPIWYKGKSITTFHDLTLIKTYNSDKNWVIFHLKQLVGRSVFKAVAKKSDHIITVSEYTKKDLIAFTRVPKEKISVIYEASESAVGGSKSHPLPFKRYILYVGQQSDYKNVKRLGDAHQKLRESYPELGLVLAGKKNASAQKNESYFKNKGYTGIHFTDFVPDEELNWLYKHAEAYIFPSLMEGFGLPGLEAMSHGTPVISSNATCLPEIYGTAARYFDPLDTADISRVIAEVLGNPALKRQLSAEGYQRIKKFSWKKMAKETHYVYLEALKRS